MATRATHALAGLSCSALFACASTVRRVDPPPAPPPTAALAAPAHTPVTTPAGVVLSDVLWHRLWAKSVVVHYPAGFQADAERYQRYFDAIHVALAREFPGVDVSALMRSPVTCNAYLHPRSGPVASANAARAIAAGGKSPHCELHFLAPSAHSAEELCCTVVGETRDDAAFHRVATHEYVGIALLRMNRASAGYPLQSAPAWFTQGYEEYLALTLSTDHARTITFGKYFDVVRKSPDRVGPFHVTNPYVDGAMLLAFLHDEVGQAKVQRVLVSSAKTFADALEQELAMPPEELFARWRKWIQRGLPAPVGPEAN